MELLKQVGDLYLDSDAFIFDYLFDNPRIRVAKDCDGCEGQTHYALFLREGELHRKELTEEKKANSLT